MDPFQELRQQVPEINKTGNITIHSINFAHQEYYFDLTKKTLLNSFANRSYFLFNAFAWKITYFNIRHSFYAIGVIPLLNSSSALKT